MSSLLAIFFAIIASCSLNSVAAQNNDLFNYAHGDKNENGVTSRGQPNWGQVRCGNAEICVSTVFDLGRRSISLRFHHSHRFLFVGLVWRADWISQQIPSSAAKLFILSVGYR